MAETGLTTVGVLETSSIDPLPENSPMETEDLSEEEEAAALLQKPQWRRGDREWDSMRSGQPGACEKG